MVLVYLLFLISGRFKVLMNFIGISSPIDLTLLFAILLTLDLVLYVSRGGKVIISKNIFVAILFLCLFFLQIVISKFYTPSDEYALQKVVYFNLSLLAFFYPLLKKDFDLRAFVRFLIYTGLFFGIVNLLYFGLYLSKIISYQQFSIASGDYISIGQLLGLNVILLSFSEIKNYFRGDKRLIFLILSFVLLLFSGARGPIIFTFVILIIYFLLKRGKVNFRFKRNINIRKFIIISIGIIVIIIIIYIFRDVFFLMSKRYIQLIDSFIFGKLSGGYDIRKEYIYFVFTHCDDSLFKFVFGHGIGSFGYYFLGQDIELYPHNLILEILFELGFSGFIVFVFFVVFTINRNFKNKLILFSILFIFLNALKSFSLNELRMFFGFLALVNLKWERA